MYIIGASIDALERGPWIICRLSLVQAQRKALGWVAANIPDFSWFLLISG